MGFSDAPKIERGLAQYEPDHFATLGVPVTADARQISECYKRVAKALRAGFVGNSEEAEQASTLFAKWVNPAKEVLSKPGEKAEYDTLLQLYIRRLVNENSPEDLWPGTEICNSLRQSADWESAYQEKVAQIAAVQYTTLEAVVERTSQLSELNLAYLLMKAGVIKPAETRKTSSQPAPTPTKERSSSPPFSTRAFEPGKINAPPPRRTSSQPIPKPPENAAETRYKQAVEMMERGQYKEAVKFLGFAINENPLSEYYLRRAEAYLKQGIRGMARADYQQVLRQDPKNEEAQKGLRRTAPTAESPSVQASTRQKPQSASKEKTADSGGGGFLSRLFGRK